MVGEGLSQAVYVLVNCREPETCSVHVMLDQRLTYLLTSEQQLAASPFLRSRE